MWTRGGVRFMMSKVVVILFFLRWWRLVYVRRGIVVTLNQICNVGSKQSISRV